MSLAKVSRGQQITQAQMDSLADLANSKLGGHYFFPQSVWQVPDRDTLLKFDLADWGQDPGGIVVVKDERKVYQLRPFRTAQAGKRSWEILENWEIKEGWRVVPANGDGGIFEIPPYCDNLKFETASIGDVAAIIAPWARSHITFPPQGGIQSPEIWQFVGTDQPSNFFGWRRVGGCQEVGHGLLASGTGANAVSRISRPLWTTELRAIQSAGIRKLSDSAGFAHRNYLYGQRQISVAGVIPQFTTARQLRISQQGAPMPWSLSANHLPALINKVRMYREIDYYSRGPGTEVAVECRVRFSDSDSANFMNPPYGLPAGVSFNFRILNEGQFSNLTRRMWGYIDILTQGVRLGTWSDSTGVGTVDITLDRNGNPVANNSIRWGIRDDGNHSGVSWPGGDFSVNWQSGASSAVVTFDLLFRVTVGINDLVKASYHKNGPVYRGRLPDIAVELNGYTTQIGSVPEIAEVTAIPLNGDTTGAYLAKPAASTKLHNHFDLKYPYGGFPPSVLEAWSLVPYPCYRWRTTGTANLPKWSLAVDEPGHATLYDLCVTRVSSIPGRLNYTNAPSLTVPIGIRTSGNSFARMFDVTIPPGQGFAHADPNIIKDVVLMDDGPLFYDADGVSVVQAMALRRNGQVGQVPGSNWDFQGAQAGFSESYNETVDLLESLP